MFGAIALLYVTEYNDLGARYCFVEVVYAWLLSRLIWRLVIEPNQEILRRLNLSLYPSGFT